MSPKTQQIGASLLSRQTPAKTSVRGPAAGVRYDATNAARKLRRKLKDAETKQAADWIRNQHKVLERDLSQTASRLQEAATVSTDGLDDWPANPVSSLRVEGLGISKCHDTAVSRNPRAPLPRPQEPSGAVTISPVRSARNYQRRPRDTPPGSMHKITGKHTSHARPPRQDGTVAKPSKETSERMPDESIGNIFDRARAAIVEKGLDARMLNKFLLPIAAATPEDSTVSAWELYIVLTADLGMELSNSDKQVISEKCGVGENQMVDVRTFLSYLGFDEIEPKLSPEDPTSSPVVLLSDPMAEAVKSTRTPPPAQGGGDTFSSEEPKRLPGQSMMPEAQSEVTEALTVAAITSGSGGGATTVKEDVRRDMGKSFDKRRTEERRNGIDNGDRVGDVDEPVGVRNNVSTHDLGKGTAGTIEEGLRVQLEEENSRLKAELGGFDLGFFEEVEDLKYSYAKLKKEAEKLAEKKGVNLSRSLGLPEDGEEPWARPVDMAHNAVNWQAVSSELPPRSSSPCPRGTHVSRLAKQWEFAERKDGPDFNMTWPGASAPPKLGGENRKTSGFSPGFYGKWKRGGTKDYSALGTGVVGELILRSEGWIEQAAHERKLAWEISSGDMRSLTALRECAQRFYNSSGGFLTEQQMFDVFRHAGYALDAEDVTVLRTGLGIDSDGKVDLTEFMGMCEDIASHQEWYQPIGHPARQLDGMLSSGEALFPGGQELESSTNQRLCSDEMLPHRSGTGVLYPEDGMLVSPPISPLRGPGGSSSFLGGTVYGDKRFFKPAVSRTIHSVMAELQDQLSLLDVNQLTKVVTARMGASFAPARGQNRSPEVIRPVAEAVNGKFVRRDPLLSGVLSARELSLALEDIGVTLQAEEAVILAKQFRPPGLASSASDGKHNRHGNESGWGSGLDDTFAEYAPLVRLIVDSLMEKSGIDPATGERTKTRRAGDRFLDFDLDGDGTLGQREFLRALDLALSETGDGSFSFPEFTIGDVLTKNEAMDLTNRLVATASGKICWEDVLEFLANADDDEEPLVKPLIEPWYQVHGDIAEKLVDHMESQGGATARRAWLNTLTRKFHDADINNVGTLDSDEFSRCLKVMRVGLSVREGERLSRALHDRGRERIDRAEEGGRGTAVRVIYPKLLHFLRSKNQKWYQAERDIADKIARAMGSDPPSRRAWLNRLRRRFMSLDAFRVGVLGASDLLQALRDGTCCLSVQEEARLLDALETEESARYDTEGGVSYRELLLFCSRNAGKWNETQPEVAERLRAKLRKQAKTASDIRRLFRRMDSDGDGIVGRKDFMITLHRLGLGSLSREEQESLMDSLDPEGLGQVRYGDFAAFFMDADPWFERDSDLAERLCRSLQNSSRDAGTVLRMVRERFVEADRDRRGFVERKQFMEILQDFPGTKELNEEDVDRLLHLLDDEGNGKIWYRSLLKMLVGHMSDWTKRLPEAATELSFSLQQSQYGRKGCVENLSRRVDIADANGIGRISPAALGRCLRSVGLSLSREHLRDMVNGMDVRGDGLIPTAPVVDFLKEVAGIIPRKGERRKRGQESAIEGEFRDAVRSLVSLEEQMPFVDDDDYDGFHGERIRRKIPWRTRLRTVFDRKLDLDGDGYLTEVDLRACLPEIGVSGGGEAADALLKAMDSRERGLGQATFKDFMEFMGNESSTDSSSAKNILEYADEEGTILATPARVKGLTAEFDRGLWREARDSLGVSVGDLEIHRDMEHAMARLDVRGTGRLPLGKLKAALQELGLPVGSLPRKMWMDLTESLDPDANGHIFYDVFLAKLLLPRTNAMKKFNESPWSNTRPSTARSRSKSPVVEDRRRPSSSTPSSYPSRLSPAAGSRTANTAGKEDELWTSSMLPIGARQRLSPWRNAPRRRLRTDLEDDDRPSAPRTSPYYEPGHRPKHVGRRSRLVDDTVEAGSGQHERFLRQPSPSAGRRPSYLEDGPRGDRRDEQKRAGSRNGDRKSLRPFQGYTRTRTEVDSGGVRLLKSLRDMILDALDDEHGGAAAGARALRSALRRQDLTRRGTLSKGELMMALQRAGAPLGAEQMSPFFVHFGSRGTGDPVLKYDKFADFVVGPETDDNAAPPIRDKSSRSLRRRHTSMSPRSHPVSVWRRGDVDHASERDHREWRRGEYDEGETGLPPETVVRGRHQRPIVRERRRRGVETGGWRPTIASF